MLGAFFPFIFHNAPPVLFQPNFFLNLFTKKVTFLSGQKRFGYTDETIIFRPSYKGTLQLLQLGVPNQ